MTSDTPPSPGGPGAAPGGGLDAAQLSKALKAFKKRMKLSRLDDESRLERGPMSKGGNSGIVAITPPAQFPQAVWDELVRQGRLRPAGYGMYELGDER
jgi:hypothetical protein